MSTANRYLALAVTVVLSTSTLAHAQFFSDANLDGAVNGSDFAILSENFYKATGGSNQGTDFSTLASGFNSGDTNSPAVIPEPASASLLAIASLRLFARRRRNI